MASRAWVVFKELTELELVTGTRTEHTYTHTQKHTLMHTWIDCCGSLMLFFFFFFYKPVSFTEGDLRLLALPGGSSISVMGGCGGLHHVPVNFNHIKLSRPLTEGMPALYIPLARLLSLKWRFQSFVEVLWEQRTVRNTSLMWKLLQTEDIVRGMI